MKELVEIQKELKAPKNQRNNFGKYNYRSCEDILEAVKPLANERGCVVLLSDEVKVISERVYVCATAEIRNDKGNVKTTAYAREPLSQKGMNEAQITGSASSYARKYALNGLFAIDDTKDSDTDEHKNQENKEKPILEDKGFKFLTEQGTIDQIKLALSDRKLTDVQKKALDIQLKELQDGGE